MQHKIHDKYTRGVTTLEVIAVWERHHRPYLTYEKSWVNPHSGRCTEIGSCYTDEFADVIHGFKMVKPELDIEWKLWSGALYSQEYTGELDGEPDQYQYKITCYFSGADKLIVLLGVDRWHQFVKIGLFDTLAEAKQAAQDFEENN